MAQGQHLTTPPATKVMDALVIEYSRGSPRCSCDGAGCVYVLACVQSVVSPGAFCVLVELDFRQGLGHRAAGPLGELFPSPHLRMPTVFESAPMATRQAPL